MAQAQAMAQEQPPVCRKEPTLAQKGVVRNLLAPSRTTSRLPSSLISFGRNAAGPLARERKIGCALRPTCDRGAKLSASEALAPLSSPGDSLEIEGWQRWQYSNCSVEICRSGPCAEGLTGQAVPSSEPPAP